MEAFLALIPAIIIFGPLVAVAIHDAIKYK